MSVLPLLGLGFGVVYVLSKRKRKKPVKTFTYRGVPVEIWKETEKIRLETRESWAVSEPFRYAVLYPVGAKLQKIRDQGLDSVVTYLAYDFDTPKAAADYAREEIDTELGESP
jgi:hypothetical protein